jgi:uncharacterized protein
MARSDKFAVVTGASTGIGFHLADECAKHGYDLLIAADESRVETAANELKRRAIEVEAIKADLSNMEGVERLYAAAGGRPIDILIANAGRGLGRDFLDQDFTQALKVIDTNITGTVYLLQKVGRDMRARHSGRILIVGSIAGFIPGAYQAIYNGTKAFLDSFSFALRAELDNSGVSVTCLMPGATDTEFFARADMLDTRIGTDKKDDPAEVARVGFEAMMRGDGDIVSGWHNKLRVALSHITPAAVLAEQHKRTAAPGTARQGR